MARQGGLAQAFRLLEQGAAAGDAYAALTLADWRLSGDLIRRDLGMARSLFGQAADLGLAEAAPIHLALLASGAGGLERHWDTALDKLRDLARRDPLARRQRDLVAAMELIEAGDPESGFDPEPVCQSPHIQRFGSFLTAAECRYLIDRATPLLQPAVVVHPQTGQQMRDPIRTARFAAFPFVLEDPAIHALNRRIAAATATDYAQGEPLQVLCYDPGEEYKLHSDALPSGQNQRTSTFLCWLNEGYAGGATAFPDATLDLRGPPGDAIHFRNVLADGRPDPRARHCGTPVTAGRKWLLSKWIRERPLDLTGLPGRPF
jgi:prolyl 4-hydroxylase